MKLKGNSALWRGEISMLIMWEPLTGKLGNNLYENKHRVEATLAE